MLISPGQSSPDKLVILQPERQTSNVVYKDEVFAWKVADEMLHQQHDTESCYFAAQTMRTKIQLAFHELPPEAHNSLRDSLLEHIAKVNESTKSIIVTQLCLALADLALQMPTWQKPVLDLINQFNSTAVSPLLEVMTVLPEEVNSRTLRLGANRRQQVLQELTACVPVVSSFLPISFTDNSTLPNPKFPVFSLNLSIAISFSHLTRSEINDTENLNLGSADNHISSATKQDRKTRNRLKTIPKETTRQADRETTD
ncbi:hypothetical protein J6590_020955 [Homalodisca vitripennis]|nr:hypothetical protein J6590_020955 [Homalodisca vitripennis]